MVAPNHVIWPSVCGNLPRDRTRTELLTAADRAGPSAEGGSGSTTSAAIIVVDMAIGAGTASISWAAATIGELVETCRERVGWLAGQWSGWGTATTVSSSIAVKSRGLQVWRERSVEIAIAAIMAS